MFISLSLFVPSPVSTKVRIRGGFFVQMVILLTSGGIKQIQEILGKAWGVRIPSLDAVRWKGTQGKGWLKGTFLALVWYLDTLLHNLGGANPGFSSCFLEAYNCSMENEASPENKPSCIWVGLWDNAKLILLSLFHFVLILQSKKSKIKHIPFPRPNFQAFPPCMFPISTWSLK